MFSRLRYLRWCALLISLTIEAIVFWFAGPHTEPDLGFWQSVWLKAQSGVAWTWVGWVSFSLFWLTHELVRALYIAGRRTRRLIAKDRIVKYETGLHWLVLLRDFRTGRLNDGDEAELNEPLSKEEGSRQSFSWHAIWVPIVIAISTLLFHIGWVAWLVAKLPETILEWTNSLQDIVNSSLYVLPAFLIGGLDSLISALPSFLSSLRELARRDPQILILVIFGTWFLLHQLQRISRRVFPLVLLLHLGGHLTFILLLFAVLSMSVFDSLWPIYTLLPQNGPVAMGFFFLTFANVYYLPHLMTWSSWRYAIVQDTITHRSRLLMVGGVLNYYKREFDLQRIVDTYIKQLWWERIFDIGSVELIDIGGQRDVLRHISGPNKLEEMIMAHIKEYERQGGGSDQHGLKDTNDVI